MKTACSVGRCRPGVLWTTLVLAACAGCGGGTYPVAGKVVFEDGKDAVELAGGTVHFESVDRQPAVSAHGVIQPDGTFHLETQRPGDGAYPGRYRVLVSPPARDDRDGARPLPPVLDSRYEKYETSGLEFSVDRRANQLTVPVRKPGSGR